MNRKSSPRFCILQPDYLLLIVRKPRGWRPLRLTSVPPELDVVRTYLVGSFQEAHDDLIRCNRSSLKHSLDLWAVVQSTEAGL